MFDIGWSELLVIGVVALIVVGPKDLPRMFRTLGEVTGKARRMAREFQTAMNQAADESGVGGITKDLRRIANPKKFGTDAFKDATAELRAWRPDEPDGKPRSTSRGFDAAEISGEPDLLPDPAAAPPKPAEPAPKAAATAGKTAGRPAAKTATRAAPSKAPAAKAAPAEPVAQGEVPQAPAPRSSSVRKPAAKAAAPKPAAPKPDPAEPKA